jgi:hypothetical protein
MNRIELICSECQRTVLLSATLAGENSPCPECGAEAVSWSEPRKAPATPSAPAGNSEAQWHYSVDDQVDGPVTESQLLAMLEVGTIRRSDLVWREGMPDWDELGTIPGFFLKLKKAKPSDQPIERKKRSLNRDNQNDNADEGYRESRRGRRKWRPERPDYTIPIVIAVVVIVFVLGALALVGLGAWAVAESAKKREIEGTSTQYGKRIYFNGGELYYTWDVTLAEANRLGNYLVKESFFDGSFKSVQLARSGGTYQVRYVVKDGWDKKPDYITTCIQFARELSENVFYGAPTEIHLCNDRFETLRVCTP